MIFLLGFRTPNLEEVPEILYIGNDGDEVNRLAEASLLPRLARMVNPQLYPIRHWSEEAAAAFAQQPAVPCLDMLERIVKLEELLLAERTARDEERAAIQEEFKRKIAVATDEITALRTQLAEAQANIPTTPQVASPSPEAAAQPSSSTAPAAVAETPAADSASAEPAAASDGPQLDAPEAKPGKRGGK